MKGRWSDVRVAIYKMPWKCTQQKIFNRISLGCSALHARSHPVKPLSALCLVTVCILCIRLWALWAQSHLSTPYQHLIARTRGVKTLAGICPVLVWRAGEYLEIPAKSILKAQIPTNLKNENLQRRANTSKNACGVEGKLPMNSTYHTEN